MRLAIHLTFVILLALLLAPVDAFGAKVDVLATSAACGTVLSGSIPDFRVHTQESAHGV
jgi:hypothetical protein